MFRLALFVVPAAARDIKVLSYSGQGAGIEDVDNQHMCFERDLIDGVRIRGTKSPYITAQQLQNYDVLLMPGGSLYYTSMDQDAIRSFVRNGGGYYGTCAGAYAGCTTVGADQATGRIDPWDASVTVEPIGNDTNGMPVYPDQRGLGLSSARCEFWYQVGATNNALTAEGEKAFPNQKSVVAIDHHNGPAMTPNQATTLATFSGGAESGKASIIGDTYGSGKVILVSPHPEHPYLQNCDIITYMAAYAAGVDVSSLNYKVSVKAEAVEEAVALPTGLLLDDSTVEQDMAKNSEMMREFEEGNYVSTLNVSRPFFQQCDQACSNWCWATGAVMASSAFTSVSCKADEAAVASREFHAQCTPGSGTMCNWQCNRAGQMENIIDGIQFKSGASYAKDGVMSQQQLDSALQKGPVVLGVMWTQGGGHAITISGGSGGSYTGHDPEGYPINTNYGGLLTYRAPYGGVGRWKECVRPSGFEMV